MIKSMVVTEIYRDTKGVAVKVTVCFFDEKGIEVFSSKLDAILFSHVHELKKGTEVTFIEKIRS